MLSLGACQALTGGDDFEVSVIDSAVKVDASVMAEAGRGGEPSKAGEGGGGASGIGMTTAPIVEECERTISGAPCNLAPSCGCEEGKSCAVTGSNGSTPILACVTPGPNGPGSVCTGPSDCGPGLLCLGGERGVCRPYCDNDNDCFGDGVCSPVLSNDGVPLDGARACFQRCATNNDCATDCCVANKCADASLCEPVPLGGACTSTDMCEGGKTGKAACEAGTCRPRCTTNSDCSSQCCVNSMCAGASVCAPPPPPPPTPTTPTENVPIGGVCESNGQCEGYSAGQSGCVNFSGQSQPRCAAQCQEDDDCNSKCCVPTDGPSFCGPPENCGEPAPPVCKETGTTCESNGDCCGFSEGEARCVRLTETVAGCAAACDAHSDCVSGCCAPTDSGNYLCLPPAACGN